jgi:hypothetical protein
MYNLERHELRQLERFRIVRVSRRETVLPRREGSTERVAWYAARLWPSAFPAASSARPSGAWGRSGSTMTASNSRRPIAGLAGLRATCRREAGSSRVSRGQLLFRASERGRAVWRKSNCPHSRALSLALRLHPAISPADRRPGGRGGTGRRARFRSWYSRECVGSSPSARTSFALPPRAKAASSKKVRTRPCRLSRR